MARNLVILTAALWLLVLMFAVGVARQPLLALWPLYGLYPGEVSSGEPNYQPAAMHAWAVGVGVVFLSLASFAVWRKNTAAAVTLLALFVSSVVILIARASAAFGDFH